MKKFITLTMAMFISRGFDIYTTYLYIPDLQGETNILVRSLNLGWTSALLIQLIALLFLTYCLKVFCFNQVDLGKVEHKLTLTQFVSQFHVKRPDYFSKLLYRFPDNSPSMRYAIGGIVPKGLIVIGFLVGTSTSGLLLSKTYRSIYRSWDIPFWLYLLMPVIMLTLTIDFYRKERVKAGVSFQ